MLKTDETTRLGPAHVTGAEGGRVRALFEGGEIEAVNALAFPWTPRAGDVVLVISQEDAHFIIGVLHTQGDFTFNFPAGVTFRAPRGAMNFHSGESVDLHAPEVRVTAGNLTFLAGKLTEKVTSAFRWVKDLVQLKAGRSRTVIEGTSHERAQRRVIRADKDVRVNGERIHLG